MSAVFDDANFSSPGTGLEQNANVDRELKEFLMVEKQKAEFNAQIHEFNDICWEKCIDKPGSKLDPKAEMCLNNCVERFLDVTFFITNRFAQLVQKSGKF